jgi:hypothetical protein
MHVLERSLGEETCFLFYGKCISYRELIKYRLDTDSVVK